MTIDPKNPWLPGAIDSAKKIALAQEKEARIIDELSRLQMLKLQKVEIEEFLAEELPFLKLVQGRLGVELVVKDADGRLSLAPDAREKLGIAIPAEPEHAQIAGPVGATEGKKIVDIPEIGVRIVREAMRIY